MRIALHWHTPVDEFCLWDGEIQVSGVSDGPDLAKGRLEGSAV